MELTANGVNSLQLTELIKLNEVRASRAKHTVGESLFRGTRSDKL